MRYLYIVIFLLVCAGLALTQTPQPASQTSPSPSPSPSVEKKRVEQVTVGISTSYEGLTNGLSPWSSQTLEVSAKLTAGPTLYGSFSLVRRFNLNDRNLMLGYTQRLGKAKRWYFTAEGSYSPTNAVLARWSTTVELARKFSRGWAGHASGRYGAYASGRANLATVGADKYFRKNYSVGYTLYLGNSARTRISNTHLVHGNYYYGEANSLRLTVAAGRSLESLGRGGIVATNTKSLNFLGQHWFNKNWGLVYNVGIQQQGNIYQRRGFSISLRRRF